VKNDELLVNFGVHLRKLREKYNISMQTLSDESEISKTTIYRIENAKLNPTLSTLISLAQGLNITLVELMDFTNPN